MKYKILLFYKYISLENPEGHRVFQRELCESLDIKGRIIISVEGINGTVAGKAADIDKYMEETEKLALFADIEWKVSWAEEQVFPKLKVVVRDEIVTLGIKKNGWDVRISKRADYIEPEQLADLYERNEDFVIIDARNLYEANIGRFKNALVAPIDNFRDFPKFAATLTAYKDKEVVTYCTGGIRCEKASAYLRENEFKKVRQLHGGIHQYGEKVGGKYFEGEMFVFDKRLHVPVNKINPTTISKCLYCEEPIARYIDCAIASCNALFICCKGCQGKYSSTCSRKCLVELTSKDSSASNFV